MTIEKLKKALEDFNYAGQALSTVWSEIQEDSPGEIALMNVSEKYPFPRCFNEMSYNIHTWCEDALEEIERQQILQLFKNGSIFVFAIKVLDIDEENYIDEGWFCEAELNHEENTIRIFEESTGTEGFISTYSFKESFVIIPKELYELSKNDNSQEFYQDIRSLARRMGKKIK